MLRISLLAWATLIVVPSPSYALLARFVDTSLVISNGAERIRLPDITGRTVISRVVHAVVKQQGDYFVVFTVRAPTGRPSNGYCGAGIDSSVEWLRIHDGKVSGAVRQVRVMSS